MATIQIREIPEEAYEAIRRRARAEGRSIQSYMREWVIEFAESPTKAQLLADWEATMAASDSPGVDRRSILAALDADRR